MGVHRLRFGENLPGRTPKSEKNPSSLANKATVSVSPKTLQFHP